MRTMWTSKPTKIGRWGPGTTRRFLYNVEPGTYYVTAYYLGTSLRFQHRRRPDPNADQRRGLDAIALTAGVPCGPFSGYDGLSQYFSIDVPQGTERLEVRLDDGVESRPPSCLRVHADGDGLRPPEHVAWLERHGRVQRPHTGNVDDPRPHRARVQRHHHPRGVCRPVRLGLGR